MKILINGLPLFSARLANDLKEFDPKSRFWFADTYSSKWQQIRFLLLLPFADCVISMNGVTDNSGSLNWVLRLKKKLIMQWQGSDAMIAVERFNNKTIDRRYIDYATHLTDSQWLKSEVESLNLKVEETLFKYIFPDKPADKYESVSVMSYLSQNREDFYGMQQILAAAVQFPEIRFDLYGTQSTAYDYPPNVTVHGWISEKEFSEALKEHAIFLRITEHDGFSVSVIEALGFGCEVIWTFPGPFSVYLENRDQLGETLAPVIGKVRNRGIFPNFETARIAAATYNRETVIRNYGAKLKALAG